MYQLSQLSKDIIEWDSHNETIKKLNDYTKNVKEKKNKLELSILNTIKHTNLTQKKLKLENNHIFYNTTYTMPPLSIKLLETVLDEFIDSKYKEQILEKIKIFRENNKTESVSLKKKTINRKKSNKSRKLP